MTTWCSQCDRVHSDTRKEAPWRWRCTAAPIENVGYGFVSPDYAPEPPYEKCDRKNDGACEDWTPRRTKEKAP